MALMAGLVFYALSLWGQTTIDFDDDAKWTAGSVSLTSYESDHTYVDGVFSATGGPALRNGTATQDGFPGALGTYSWRLRNDAGVDWRITISAGGVSTFSVKVRRWDASPSPDFNLEYSLDGGTVWTLVDVINNTTLDNSSDWKTFNGNINSANSDIIIRFKANGTTERIMVDDFVWSGVSGVNLPPEITNIIQTPSQDITSSTTVSASADVTDSDGTVENVELRWGTSTGVLPNTIQMSLDAGDNYITDMDIPAQSDGTTVYYIIYAEDDDEDSSISLEQSYEVRDARFTTIPYEETFDADLGDCYVNSVLGVTKFWNWNSDGWAQMNGFDSGDIEEDWLVLPGINLDIYEDEVMSFESWKRFGADDANNYLKLLYSTDYNGIGNPTLATWTELSFTQPATEQVWTSSGNIDLSAITGSEVWIAFKYRYEPGNYRWWQIDNINVFEASLPILAVSPEILSGFIYVEGSGPSASQSFEVTGLNMDGSDVTITAPANFEIAEDESGTYGSNITLLAYDGSATNIWVRLATGLAVGEYSGNIEIVGGGAVAKNVALSGNVLTDCPPLTFPFYEDFDYPVSSKLVDYCWTAHSGTGTNSVTVSEGSITYTDYLSSGIGNQVTLTSTGEDVHRQFIAQTSGTVFFSFLANITSATTSGDYFFHVSQSPLGSFRGRIFVKKNETDKLAFGIAHSSTSPNYSTFDYDLNTTYLIVLRYEIIEGASNDVSSIYINPPLNMSIPLSGWISNTDASGTDLTDLGTLALRQGSSSSAPELILDGIRVSDDWADIVGESTAPVLLPDPASLSGFTYIEGEGPSTIQSFTLNGENLSENVVLTKPASYEISTLGGGSFTPEASITLIPVDGSVAADIYVRLQASLTVGTYNEDVLITWEGDNIQVSLSGNVTEAVNEPSNHVTDFAATANSSSSITVSWTDSDAAAYLIKGSTVGFGDIVDPVDGVAEADDGLVKNILAGIESHEFTGLDPDTEHFFKIFPYNGTGATINYKVDAPVPQTSATTLEPPPSPYADVLLRPTQIDISEMTSQSAVLIEIGNYPTDDVRYRLYNGSNQYNCWDGTEYVSSNSYSAGPQVPGSPTTSSKFWILFERGSNNSTVASYRDRLGPDYTSNYQTQALPAATAMVTPYDISLSIPFTGTYDLDVKYVVLGFDAEVDGNLISATSSDLTTGAFILKAEDGTTIRRIEVRTVLDVLIDELVGEWPAVVPENRTVDMVTLGNEDVECYDATNNITVTNTVIGNGASAEFRAGVSINFGDGFIAESGSYVLAVITDVYCSLPENMLASEEVVIPAEIPSMTANDSFFKVYPNPTSNSFTLELNEFDESLKITVEIYGMMGERILQDELFGSQLYHFEMSTMPKGVYILRVLKGDQTEMQKIIRQ